LHSFSVPHDAADPVSYVVESQGARLGIACDMGKATSLVKLRLQHCQGLVLESNYCPDMLMKSSYPAAIRSRIDGSHGHMSNRDACSLLSSVLHDALRLVVLIHISDENNTHDRALEMARRVVAGRPVALHIASKDKPTPLFEVVA
jgi:phosphoribosyl 1,2-cyclic phosphodiesterase